VLLKRHVEREVPGARVVLPQQPGGAALAHSDRPLDALAENVVRSSLAQAAPVIEKLRAIAKAECQAATDELTGLPNARSVHEALRRMSAHAARAGKPLSAVMLDIDHFKQVNDGHGHDAGDDALAAVGATLRGSLRESDFVGRYGGEEFLVLLPDTDLAGALVLAEKLRTAIAATSVPAIDRQVTASFGVATFPEHAADGPDLMREADRALYRAKQAGRDRVEHQPRAHPVRGLRAVSGR
jgi:diguanylate cyclase (GGDEF)-like protein